MDKVIAFEGDALKSFLEEMHAIESRAGVYRLRFAIDPIDGGLKWKVNEYPWTPARGEMRSH